MRLDQYVVENTKLSRNKSQALIKSWYVEVDWKKITKVWYNTENKKIVINLSEESKYVSRSALKLKYFLEDYNLNIENLIAMDIWSSTWWFCQVLLEKWINKVYAIDVWSSQLDEKIKNNKKIISIENTDIRKLWNINEGIDIITCDVSFISLTKIIDSIIKYINNNTKWILLYKPQFEVWQEYINNKWVVINDNIVKEKLEWFINLCKNKWLIINQMCKSKLKWENWNQEYIIYITK